MRRAKTRSSPAGRRDQEEDERDETEGGLPMIAFSRYLPDKGHHTKEGGRGPEQHNPNEPSTPPMIPCAQSTKLPPSMTTGRTAVQGGTRPEAILHLGGISFVPLGWTEPQKNFSVNTIGTLNILDAVRQNMPRTRILVVRFTVVSAVGSKLTVALDESIACDGAAVVVDDVAVTTLTLPTGWVQYGFSYSGHRLNSYQHIYRRIHSFH